MKGRDGLPLATPLEGDAIHETGKQEMREISRLN